MPGLSLRIGLFGGGIVGGGVVELVERYKENGKLAALGGSIEIVKICVRSKDKPRDFTVGANTQIVTDYEEILGDSSINCVVELMGGITHAKEVVFAAIKAGKHVITANKALIATYLPEIQALLAANPSVKLAYEAAVCGGIPIIHSLQTDYVCDTISKVMGIMNGTTNFMLCKMEDEGAEYSAALAEAQALGYAEADPTADVEGYDVQAKIALLTKLAFGNTVPVASIPCVGISKLTKIDFDYAKLLKSTIKLIGTANVNADGSIAVFVSPSVVSRNSPLASAKGPGNMVLVNSNNLCTSSFAGPGAGRYPTANSVLNDLLRIAVGQDVPAFPFNKELALDNDYTARFYVRTSCLNQLGIVRMVGQAAENERISIHSIFQNAMDTEDEEMEFVVTTDPVKLSKVRAFAEAVKTMPFAKGMPLFMPMI